MKMMTAEQIASACPDSKWKIERARLFLYWGQFLKGEVSGPESDIGTRTLFVTRFEDETAQSMGGGSRSLPALCDHILATDAASKGATPWLKLAVFGNRRTKNNCLRHDANVTEISGIEVDYDDEKISFDDAIEIMRKADVRCLLYTSASHTPETPRWRVLVPLSKNYPPASRAPMVGRVNGLFNGSLAPESFVLSTSYHYGSVNRNPHHQAIVLDGGFLDLNDRLYAGSIDQYGHRVGHKDFEQAKSTSERSREPGNPFSTFNADPADRNEIIAALAVIDADCSRLMWYKIASAIWFELRDDGKDVFHKWSATAPKKYNEDECDMKWSEAVGNPYHTAGTIFRLANLASPEWRERFADANKKAGGGVGDDDLARLNGVYAVLPIGGKTRIVTFGVLEEFPGRETIVMTQSIGDFMALQNKYRHQYLDKKGELQSVPMGAYWINSQHRRQYDGGLAFMPQHIEDVVGNKLNLWRGYGVDAVKPDGKSGAAGCKLFLDFMRDVICNKNDEHFEYLTKREATILQKRIRSEIALGLRSDDEGVGKGFYETVMGHLLGEHAMQVGNPKHVIGAFNPHLESLLRLTADEALFVGNPEHRNSLFGLITEPKLTIEPKGCGVYRADSFLNLSVTSNAKHFLPISGTARRFFIPTISPEHIQDHAYFKAIKDQLNDGGYEALLYYFLNEVDLKDFNVRLVPKTEGLMEQRNHSLLPLEAWWVELLESGTIAGADPNAPNRAVSNEYQREVEIDLFNGTTQSRFVRQLGIFDQARLIEPRLKHHFSDHRLGTYLSEMGCDNHKRVLRRRGWTFPDLMACRSEWVKRFPGWPWRDAALAEWRPEEDVRPEAETEMTCEEKVNAAAKAQEVADRLAKVAELAKIDAKFRP
jgi:Primase C terminal 2 (PriCT-2)